MGALRQCCGRCLYTLLPVVLVAAMQPFGFECLVAAGNESHRVLPPGRVPEDTRLGPLRIEQGNFPFVPARSKDHAARRSQQVRRSLLVSLGLWPLPTSTPLNPVIHGKIDQEDYTVEKVYFESLPGFFVTGNLYRPQGEHEDSTKKCPAVLSPHGHFPGGRFQDAEHDTIRWDIARGAERFEASARSFMQSRCVQLARMGCVVFHYDMIGYGDSQQIPRDLAHRFPAQRVRYKQAPASGFYSAAAELQLQSLIGLHTYNSIRALDFLLSLPDVDKRRIAVTGASGGGTQTFLLCAVDERPLVSVPAVIVSTTRQGGCMCEHSSFLRIGANNLDFTALHAPKPLLLISADDATRTMPLRGFPELKKQYRMLGKENHLSHAPLLHFPHNYNFVSRTTMYHWLNLHLNIGLVEPILERPYQWLSQQELSVWDEQHSRPEGGVPFQQKLLDWLTVDAQTQFSHLLPHDRQSLNHYREIVGQAWDVLLGCSQDDRNTHWKIKKKVDQQTYWKTLGLLQYDSIGEHRSELPMVQLVPKNAIKRTVIWIDSRGKQGLFEADGTPTSAIKNLLDAGITVVGVDLLGQGEFLVEGTPIRRQPCLAGEEAFASWTYCYNRPWFVHRVHDILAAIQMVTGSMAKGSMATGPIATSDDRKLVEVDLVGLDGSGLWVAAAAAQARDSLSRIAIQTDGFRFAKVLDVYDVDFFPGAAKYGDLPGLLALLAPARLWLSGERNEPTSIIKSAYLAAGSLDNLTLSQHRNSDWADDAVAWLLEEKKRISR